MEIAKGLTQHAVVLCLEKHERAITLEAVLKKRGCKVRTVESIHDAVRLVEQEMPHLVVSDAILQDGTVANIFDRLAQDSMLKSTPIMVLVAKKTREQLLPLAGRKFAEILLGPYDGNMFINKVNKVLGLNHDLSPYFISSSFLNFSQDVILSARATVVGVRGDQVIYKSDTEIDGAAAVVCVPGGKENPVLLQMGSNIVKGSDVYNAFPISRVRDKGRLWLEKLPQVDIKGQSRVAESRRRVIFCDSNTLRVEQFKEILLGYGIELVPVSTPQGAFAQLQRDAATFGCAYFHELNVSQLTALKELLGKLPSTSRISAIVGTTALSARSTSNIRFVRRPFGLGVLVEMFESAFQAAGDPVEKLSLSQASNLEVDFQASARLLGLDETGGILEVKFPVNRGSKVKLNHEQLLTLWGNETLMQVTAGGQTSPDVWQIRFEALNGNENKAKYWNRVIQFLEPHMTKRAEVA